MKTTPSGYPWRAHRKRPSLLHHGGRWFKPVGRTPTTHILKPEIGQLPNGIDLSNSVENEFYCLQLMKAFGLPVNEARIESLAGKEGPRDRALRPPSGTRRTAAPLPQEDCCQALSVPPSLKYQNQRGTRHPGHRRLLKGSDQPEADQIAFFKAQIIILAHRCNRRPREELLDLPDAGQPVSAYALLRRAHGATEP